MLYKVWFKQKFLDIPFIGGGNISKGIISLEVPYVNKIVALNQTDLEVLKESLISLKTK